MSRSIWRCRNVDCQVRGGMVLGKVVQGEGLVPELSAILQVVYLDTRRAVIVCPACGQWREFQGGWIRDAT